MGRRSGFMTRYFCRAAAFSMLLVACSSQVDSEYQGEPLATLRGVVEKSAALQPDQELVAAVVWMTQEAAPDYEPKLVGSRVAIRGTFPASFTLDLYTPPPPEAEMVTTGHLGDDDVNVWPVSGPLGIYIGMLAAIDGDADVGRLDADDILGIDLDHLLVYLTEDLPPPPPSEFRDRLPGTYEEWILSAKQDVVRAHHVRPEPGYHLARVDPAFQARLRQSDECFWRGLCVHWNPSSAQDFSDLHFKRCTERFPDNPTCSAWEPRQSVPGETEPASSVECRERYDQDAVDACLTQMSEQNSMVTEMFIENLNGLDDPITLSIGYSMFDFWP